MICIISIYKNNEKLMSYSINENKLITYINLICKGEESSLGSVSVDELSRIYFDLVDTETNTVKQHVSVKDIAYIYKEIFGVYSYRGCTFFIVTDKDTWNILDYIDDIKFIGTSTNRDFLVKKLNKTTSDLRSTFLVTTDNTLILSSFNNMEPFDDTMVFWHNNRLIDTAYFTIFDIYLAAFKTNGVVISPYTEVYLYVEPNKKAYKLDINRQVVRFMVKHITLSR